MIKKLLYLAISIVILALLAPVVALQFIPEIPRDISHKTTCLKATTEACYKNYPFLCKEYPSPCDVPQDWVAH
jgi:hypothetical protein